MNKLTLRAAQARQRFAAVRKTGCSKSLAEYGAIDLASIMVGVLVIGIIGGVIGATVFAVIPWSQDQAASQVLDSVATAESVQYSFSSSDGSAEYLDKAGLVNDAETGGNAAGESLLQDSQKIVIDTDGETYTAYSLSATGKVFSITSANPSTVDELTPTEVTAAGLTIAGGVLTLN